MKNSAMTVTRSPVFAALVLALAAGAAPAPAAAQESAAPADGTLGFVMTRKIWSIYKTTGEPECPNGYNDGPREQFAKLFPNDGTRRTLEETQLAWEKAVWFPSTSADPFPFHEAQGDVARGLNLDGQVDADDYTSPEGVVGVDNQFHRAMRCVAGYGASDAYMTFFENRVMHDDPYARILIEVTGVDSLENDDDVTLTTYRGMDGLLPDATGQGFLPYGTQRVDARWGQDFIQTFKGRIVDGVLTTEPGDLLFPWPVTFRQSGLHLIRDARFQLDLNEEGAAGLIGGYVDIDMWYLHSNTGWSTHHESYGQLSQPAVYRALTRLADAYPDPDTGRNTSISSAVEVEFTQAFIIHPPQQTASAGAAESDDAQP